MFTTVASTVVKPGSQIRAAVCRAHGAPLTVEDVELRPPGPGEVGVRLAACSICHSDITLLSGDWGGDLPAVYGHEAAGIVEEVGAGVAGVTPGQPVVVTLVRYCGRCARCLRGLPALCELSAGGGASPLRDAGGSVVQQGLRTAGFAERVTVHASQVVPVGEDIPLAQAALLGCGVITGVGAVLTTARVEPGSAVGVIGAGGVGLNCVQGADIAGSRLIAAIDPVEAKRTAAGRFGASHTVDPDADLIDAIREITAGEGLDYVFVTAPSAAAVESGAALLAPGGALVLIGMPANQVAVISPETIAERSLRILGSKVGSARPQLDIPRLAALYRSGRLKLDELISARFPLAQVNEAIALAERGDALKVVVEL